MDLADQDYATEVVRYMLNSFPQQAPSPEIYASQLITLCVGRPKMLLRKMVNPAEGLVGQSEFLPSIAAVKKWLEDRAPQERILPEHRLLPPASEDKWIPPSDEQRERALKVWNAAKRNILRKAIGKPRHWDDGSMLTPENQAHVDAYIANPDNP